MKRQWPSGSHETRVLTQCESLLLFVSVGRWIGHITTYTVAHFLEN